jgi:hypothetical protein
MARVKAAADSIAAGTLIAAPRPASMQASITPDSLVRTGS